MGGSSGGERLRGSDGGNGCDEGVGSVGGSNGGRCERRVGRGISGGDKKRGARGGGFDGDIDGDDTKEGVAGGGFGGGSNYD